jgi:hypothetical protein
MTTERQPIGARVITLALVSFILCVAQAATEPATVIGKFVGTWKENEAKRKIGSTATLRFRRAANGQLEELRGPDARPLVQPVNFEGKPYAVDNSKNTIAWKQIDANHFERTLFETGKLLTTRRIQISKDGKTLTEVTERKLSDGKDFTTTVVFKRSSGDPQGLVGIWKPESIHNSEPARQKHELVGTDGLRVTTLAGAFGGRTVTLTFDGKPTAVAGPSVISGTMVAAKVLNADTIETTHSREGVVTGKETWVLSSDGKTLTMTFMGLGPNTGGVPFVQVFEKQ